jgi:hypothetical protein
MYLMPPVRSTYNPVNKRSDVHLPPLAPFIHLGRACNAYNCHILSFPIV